MSTRLSEWTTLAKSAYCTAPVSCYNSRIEGVVDLGDLDGMRSAADNLRAYHAERPQETGVIRASVAAGLGSETIQRHSLPPSSILLKPRLRLFLVWLGCLPSNDQAKGFDPRQSSLKQNIEINQNWIFGCPVNRGGKQ